ncbi:hypothetical protein Acr_12g0010250 [Actinidia rufa]|uniref:Uncharacterized protein n=1 Tax=Actinidia rufa TaxID=165716 RepID=A0A7J0FIG2_9ERIC|nr:hypothetical protein Acr_12g0010250 [Actinidia rufa]
MKLNTDGYGSGFEWVTGQAGCGGLIRNDRAEWVKGCCCWLPYCFVVDAKVWAIYKGLTVVLED